MKLSHEQKVSLLENGYVHIRNAVPRVMIDQALRAINHSVGQGMNVEDMVTFRAQSFCPEIKNTPVISDLLNRTPAWPLAESVLGTGMIREVKGGQIALRFPNLADPPARPGCHLDGMHTPTNGVPKGKISNFTMLVGVFLSDLPETNAGNFTVWPGSHRIFEQYFREHGPESLLEGMPKVPMPEPVQVTAKAGDIVLCHYQLAHGVAPNVSPHARYAVFFRLTHVDHHLDWKAPMTNLWLHWPGIREILEKG